MAKAAHGKVDSEQSRRFIETARALGCDEDEAAFDEKLRRIAKAKTTKIRIKNMRDEI